MKIVSRPANPGYTQTKIDVRDMKIDCDIVYKTVPTYAGSIKVVTSKEFYIEMRIRIPLSDSETADIAKVSQRMQNLHQAQLLEIK